MGKSMDYGQVKWESFPSNFARSDNGMRVQEKAAAFAKPQPLPELVVEVRTRIICLGTPQAFVAVEKNISESMKPPELLAYSQTKLCAACTGSLVLTQSAVQEVAWPQQGHRQIETKAGGPEWFRISAK